MIKLNDIYACVQGEGCLAGTPMVLVRLQGCEVGCPWCDTKETWDLNPRNKLPSIAGATAMKPFWTEAGESEIATAARLLGPRIPWAIVTGGEPAEQPLGVLVDCLHRHGFRVAIETSGTAMGHSGAAFDWVCVSPKLDMPGGKPVLIEALALADEIKHVVGKEADIDALERLLDQAPLKPGVVVCVQPVSQSPKATELCYRACLDRGWRLSLQMHKYLEKP